MHKLNEIKVVFSIKKNICANNYNNWNHLNPKLHTSQNSKNAKSLYKIDLRTSTFAHFIRNIVING